jgi:uncharacterized coiled-coil DUF342 family protein
VTGVEAPKTPGELVLWRLDALEEEVRQLRTARHDHAGQIQSLLASVHQIRADLAKLQALPDELRSVADRLLALERELVARHEAAIERDAAISERLGRLEQQWGRLGRWGAAGLVVGQVLGELVARLMR